MEKNLFVSPSPHIHGGVSTTRLMGDVLIALLPAFVVSVVVYGTQALILTGVSVAACVFFEYVIQRYLLKGSTTVCDLSAVLTGVLLAFNLPAELPLWMVVLGALVAIGIGKMSFGGLGRNPFNPALVGRVFLLISFPVEMTTFGIPDMVDSLSGATMLDSETGATLAAAATDAVSGPTLLGYLKAQLAQGQTVSQIMGNVSYTDMLWGFKAGSFGEIASLALLAGFVYMLIRKVITWHIPVFVLGSMAAFAAILWGIDPEHYVSPLFHLMSGGALLGAIFMATDYVTSPMTHKGMAIYGIGIGVITMLIRVWGAYPEGMSFAILIMNAVVPLLNKYIKPRRFGEVQPQKK